MAIDYEPSYGQHAQLVDHSEADDRLVYADMQDFSLEALDAALESGTSVCFRHHDLDRLADQLRTERKTISFKTSGDLKSISWIFVRAGDARIRIKEVSTDALLLDEAARLLRAQNYDVPYHGEGCPASCAAEWRPSRSRSAGI